MIPRSLRYRAYPDTPDYSGRTTPSALSMAIAHLEIAKGVYEHNLWVMIRRSRLTYIIIAGVTLLCLFPDLLALWWYLR